MRYGIVTDWETAPVVIDLPYAARIVGLTPERLRYLAKRNKFPAHKCGGGWRVDRDELRQYIRTGKWESQKGEANNGG